jgi:uncharacterized protein YcfL
MTTRGLVLSLGLVLAPAVGCSHRSSPADIASQSPASQGQAVAVGAAAPEAQLVGTAGDKVALADLLHRHAQTVVVFYRGFW